MNKFVIGESGRFNNHNAELGIKDKKTFNKFLKDLKDNDVTRNCGGMIQTSSCERIAKTLNCFQVEVDEYWKNTLVIEDISEINAVVFNNEKSELDIFQWITKGMIEEIGDKIDENTRYGGYLDDEFLRNVRDFLTNVQIIIEGYELSKRV